MIYGAIIEKGEQYYTYLGKVFAAINNVQTRYNWLITDIDCVPHEIYTHLVDENYCWLTGEEVTQIIREDDSQWVWAVLSGFDKGIPLSKILDYPAPYADGHKGFWQTPLSMQHPLASIEIVPWDSSLTLILSHDKEIIENFMKAFPLSEDLSVYNTKNKRCPEKITN